MTVIQRMLGRGAERFRRKDTPRIPRWLHTILEIPLERVAKRVSEGRLSGRVPTSMVADHELTRLSRIINEMLDSFAAEHERMGNLGAEVVYAEERERSQVARELHASVSQKLADASFQIAAAANEMGSHAGLSRLAQARELLRTAIEEIRNISRSGHPRVATDLGLPSTLEAVREATRRRSLVDVGSTADIPGLMILDQHGVAVRQDIRDVELWARGTNHR